MFQENAARFPCCYQKAHRFQTFEHQPEKGCKARKHQIKVGSPRKTVAHRARNFEMLTEHYQKACEPFYSVKVDSITYEETKKANAADGIDEEKSLLYLVNQFVK